MILAAWAGLAGAAARASEPLFGYVYTTDLTPKGGLEFEQWITDREGQARGHYHDLELRSEIEYGLTNNLQVSLYVNSSYLDARGNSVRGLTEGLGIPVGHDPSKPYHQYRFDGVSSEIIWRVLSPYKDGFGLAFYVEPEFGPRERELELRVIGQKNFIDDRLVLAANLWAAFENEENTNLVDPVTLEGEDSGRHNAAVWELDVGASYRFRPNWSVGLELRNHNEFASNGVFSYGAQEHAAYFAGPNVHYAKGQWFATLTWLTQFGTRGFSDDQRNQIVNGRIYGDEHTKFDGIRLKLGYVFK